MTCNLLFFLMNMDVTCPHDKFFQNIKINKINTHVEMYN